MKKSKMIMVILLILGVVSLLIGTTWAIFTYIRTGSDNTISVGRMSFISRQTKTINLAVKRHINRFPERFMFRLTETECKTISRFQIETSNYYILPWSVENKNLPEIFLYFY